MAQLELVPIKVKILTGPNGHAKYPPFNLLQCVDDAKVDWSIYIDQYGSGWLYDKTSGHKDNTADSPIGQQWGMILVPQEFAEQAVAQFGNEVSYLGETEASNFYNDKVTKGDMDEKIDKEVLEGIKLKQEMGLELTAEQLKALDPNDDTPGITKNKLKIFNDYKTAKGITIKSLKI